jgi:hypothetical protein
MVVSRQKIVQRSLLEEYQFPKLKSPPLKVRMRYHTKCSKRERFHFQVSNVDCSNKGSSLNAYQEVSN